MVRDSPFDELFRLGSTGRRWSEELIDDFMDEIENQDFNPLDTDDSRITGIRRETVNGNTRTYVLGDEGKWQQVEGGSSEDPFEVEEEDDGYRMTADMSKHLPSKDFEVSAFYNNGVLEVSFER